MATNPGQTTGLPFGTPWTLAAYWATASRSGLTQVNALPDQSLNILNNQFQIPSAFSNLAAAYAMGANAANAQLVAPSLRKYATHYVFPVDAASNPASNPPLEYMGFYNPLPITTGDLLQGLVDNSNNSEYDLVAVWLCNSQRRPVTGQIFTAWAKSSTTITANAWTLGQLSMQTTLEEGTYAIVGMYVHFNGALLARLVFPGVANAIRPGVIASTSATKFMPLIFRYGRLGVWGTFDAAVLPQVEFLGTAATTSENVYLDLVKLTVGSQAMQPSYPGQPITTAMGVSPAPVPLY